MRVEGPHPIVAVLGAINVDLVVSGAPLPGPGETVTGGTFAQHDGGKGGNQAVAAARALVHGHMLNIPEHPGPGVWMLGAVSDDQLGVAALEALREDNVQTDHVRFSPDAPTGVAVIMVAPDGENQISVAPGANALLDPAHVIGALETLQPDLLLGSLEVPEATVRAALEWSREHGIPAILNPAPFQPWARGLVPFATYVTPNEVEFEQLGPTPAGVTVIETRGRDGARIHVIDGVEDVPSLEVEVVDTTGAGDCFNGVLAAALADGAPLRDGVRRAVIAASLSVRTSGAREGMPTIGEIWEALG